MEAVKLSGMRKFIVQSITLPCRSTPALATDYALTPDVTDKLADDEHQPTVASLPIATI